MLKLKRIDAAAREAATAGVNAMTQLTAADITAERDKVLQTEAAAILALVDRLDDRFDVAIQILLDCRGRVIVTGMGKSGIICRKIAATLASTGTPAHSSFTRRKRSMAISA